MHVGTVYLREPRGVRDTTLRCLWMLFDLHFLWVYCFYRMKSVSNTCHIQSRRDVKCGWEIKLARWGGSISQIISFIWVLFMFEGIKHGCIDAAVVRVLVNEIDTETSEKDVGIWSIDGGSDRAVQEYLYEVLDIICVSTTRGVIEKREFGFFVDNVKVKIYTNFRRYVKIYLVALGSEFFCLWLVVLDWWRIEFDGRRHFLREFFVPFFDIQGMYVVCNSFNGGKLN